MKTLQDLFTDAKISPLRASDLQTVKVKNLPDSNTGDLWAIGVMFNGVEYGGTVIVSENQKEHMTLVHAGAADFAAQIVNSGDTITIL